MFEVDDRLPRPIAGPPPAMRPPPPEALPQDVLAPRLPLAPPGPLQALSGAPPRAVQPPLAPLPGGPPLPVQPSPAGGATPAPQGAELMAARTPKLEQPVPGSAEAKAEAAQAQDTDQLAAQQIWFAMVLQRREAQARMMAMLADLQTTLLATWEDVMTRRQKAVEKMMEAWDKVIAG